MPALNGDGMTRTVSRRVVYAPLYPPPDMSGIPRAYTSRTTGAHTVEGGASVVIFVPSIIPSGTFTAAYAHPFMYRQATIAFGPSSVAWSPAVCRTLIETIKVGHSDAHIPVLDGAGLAPCATSSTPVPLQNPYPETSPTGSSSRNSRMTRRAAALRSSGLMRWASRFRWDSSMRPHGSSNASSMVGWS